MAKAGEKFEELLSIMAKLRSPQGCPWDREQNISTLTPYLIEECYEVLDAIKNKSPAQHAEELGDLLLQIVFHAQISSEERKFNIEDVLENIITKLKRRHPHVFGNVKLATSNEVLKQWRSFKKDSVLSGTPMNMPSLVTAFRLSERAAGAGFDWPGFEELWEKLLSEISELKEAITQKRNHEIEHELGDLLFVIANIARKLKVNPETALRACNERFKARFHYIEKKLAQMKKKPATATLDEMEKLWQEAKTEIKEK